MDLWETLKEWFLSLVDKYHVNPYIFGGIYVSAIPLFFLCLRWTVKKIKTEESFVVPALLTGLCFISAYLYLLIAGKHIPVWVYIFIGAMIIYGFYSTIKKIKGKAKR